MLSSVDQDANEQVRRLLQELSPWVETGRLEMQRHGQGVVENVFTAFDHAVMCRACFELFGERLFLIRSFDALLPLSVARGGGHQWRFSRRVADIPPDADSTSASLLLCVTAQRAGVRLRDEIDTEASAARISELQTASGGVHTYFGFRENNDVDPVVNLRVAELLSNTSLNSGIVAEGIREYLNGLLWTCDWARPLSEYYLSAATVVELAARLAARQPGYLQQRVEQRLMDFIAFARPRGALELAQLSKAAGHFQMRDIQRSNNERLLGMRDSRGWWAFQPYYRQRTPRYIYGAAIWTSLNALQSLRAELQGRPTN